MYNLHKFLLWSCYPSMWMASFFNASAEMSPQHTDVYFFKFFWNIFLLCCRFQEALNVFKQQMKLYEQVENFQMMYKVMHTCVLYIV